MRLRERYRRLSLWNKLAVWGSLASILGLPLAVVPYLVGLNQANPPPGVSSDPLNPLRDKLSEYIKELDVIEKNWNKEYSRVEPLAERVALVLATHDRESSAAIDKVRKSALTVTEIARAVRREIQKVLDQLDVAKRP